MILTVKQVDDKWYIYGYHEEDGRALGRDGPYSTLDQAFIEATHLEWALASSPFDSSTWDAEMDISLRFLLG